MDDKDEAIALDEPQNASKNSFENCDVSYIEHKDKSLNMSTMSKWDDQGKLY